MTTDSAVTEPSKFLTHKKFDDYDDAVEFADKHGSKVEPKPSGWYVVHYWTDKIEEGS